MKKVIMSYDLIYQVYQRERQSALLSKVGYDFYEEVATLIRDLKEEYEKEVKNGTTSTKTMVLHDELKKIRTLIREIYEYRIRKITLLALTAAHEGTVDIKHLVGKELKIFDSLSGILKKNHEEMVKVEQGAYTITSNEAGTPGNHGERGPEMEERGEDEKVEGRVAKVMESKTTMVSTDPPVVGDGKGSDAEKGKKRNKKKRDLVAVQILEDLPKFVGEGGEVLILKKKDYASLSPTMAERLEKQGKARIMPS